MEKSIRKEKLKQLAEEEGMTLKELEREGKREIYLTSFSLQELKKGKAVLNNATIIYPPEKR